ncbi:MAG: 7,8-dihydro-8-oxoguanine triphosphatase [Bacteroidetes bacterium]|nr:MAG: 7,8-dihydro-8-oxoguanine triphosphatase [Bacteroidota bacterium]
MKTHRYTHARPSVSIDCAVFGYGDGLLKLLLIRRAADPYKGKWALPGGFIHEDEASDHTVSRVLFDKAGVKRVFFEQLYTFTSTNRDPRGWVISVAHYALVKSAGHQPVAGKGAEEARWFDVKELPSLAFDHKNIVQTAMNRLKGKVRYQPVGFELLPVKFSLTELQQLYEAILETALDKRNFRKKILGMGLLRELGEKQVNVAHKAAKLYRFDAVKYKELTNKGFHFEL